MARTIKKSSIIILALLLCAISAFRSNAVTVYYQDGYSYVDDGKGLVSLYGWDNRATDLVIPNSIGGKYFSSVYDYALRNNTYITSVDFSESRHLTKIGIRAFEGCNSISNDLILPTWISEIGVAAFQNCTSLSSVTIFGLKTITAQSFNYCSSLSEVTLSSNVESIEKFAFANCPSLKQIILPKTVTNIAPTAFKNDELTIYCYKDSYAQQYAIDNNISYILIDDYTVGDVNRDGKIDIVDATEIQKYLANLKKFDEAQFYIADFNGDKTVNISDATGIQKYIAAIS